jgi:hypothetical protein
LIQQNEIITQKTHTMTTLKNYNEKLNNEKKEFATTDCFGNEVSLPSPKNNDKKEFATTDCFGNEICSISK